MDYKKKPYVQYETLNLSYKQECLLSRLIKKDKEDRKRKRLNSKKQRTKVEEKVEKPIIEKASASAVAPIPVKQKSPRGRKPTGKKTTTVGICIPTVMFNRIKKIAKEQEKVNDESKIVTVQTIIKKILFDYFEEKDQLSLFDKKDQKKKKQ